MKFALLLITLFFTGLSDILAQQQTDTLQIINIPGKGYTWDGNYLDGKRMKAVLESNDEASAIYRSALVNRGTAITLLITGGVVLAGGLLNDPSVGLYKVAGGFFILLAIPLYTTYDIRMDKAVEIFNNGIIQKKAVGKSVSIGLNAGGIGISLNF
ncbi:MAG: hypothetical protein JNL22_04635 [Bacteroidales bacterium]|nr:hypothetical protein [Bacteroidales bacterium]